MFSFLFISQLYAAEPVIVAKALGLEKISESYALSETLLEGIIKEHNTAAALMIENPCADIECQKSAVPEDSKWLITVVFSKEEQYQAVLSFHDLGKDKVRAKTYSAYTLAELKAMLPEKLLQQGKRIFPKYPKEEKEEIVATKDDESTNTGETDTPTENTAPEPAKSKSELPPIPDTPPFDGLRVRASGNLGYYSYNQSADGKAEFISPSVGFQTILPDLLVDVEYWFMNNTIGIQAQAGIGLFGTKLGDSSSMESISNLRVGALYHLPLQENQTVEFGLGYHSTNGVGYQFVEERTAVSSNGQDIAGASLSVGFITRVAGLDTRIDISETFAPLPKHTRLRLMVERNISSLPIQNMNLTAHGGIHCTMRHFGFNIQDESGSVFDMQVGLFGGAGIHF